MWNTKIYPFFLSDAYTIADEISEDFLAVSVVENEDTKTWRLEVLSDGKLSIDDVNLCGLVPASELQIESKELPETNWLQKCFENFKPISIGKFYILGSHYQLMGTFNSKVCLEIDAATAFGSGEHATTEGCLMAIQTYFDPNENSNVLDLGCGSAILSMAISKLGGRRIFAYDNDPEAVKVSMKNVRKNHCSSKVKVYCNKNTEFAKRGYDFIVSNILAAPLISMSDKIVGCLNLGGTLILSGFTPEQDVISYYERFGLKVIKKYEIRGWNTVVLKKIV